MRAIASRTRGVGEAPLSLIRDGPLPRSGFAGRDSEELLVAIAKVNRNVAGAEGPPYWLASLVGGGVGSGAGGGPPAAGGTGLVGGAGGGVGVPGCGGVVAVSAAFVATAAIPEATSFPAVITSDATDFPAAATPFKTPTALLSRPMVSAIAVVETLPARNVSSTPSVKRWNRLGDAAAELAYFDSRNSM